MISSEFLISLFCAGVSSTAGCLWAYFLAKKSLRFLIAEWFLLVFAFTFLLAIFTFSEGRIINRINLYAPIVIPSFSFLRINVDGLSSSVDYLFAGVVLFLFVGFFGWLSGCLISGLLAFDIDFMGAGSIVVGGLAFCFWVSFCSLRKYRMMIAKSE